MKERLVYVDLLRVIAMVPVVVCHFTRSLESAGVGYSNKILPDTVFGVYLGDFGVCIFFVLSGISLMYTYDGELEIKKYIKKRFLGIYPMFWLTWILAFSYLTYKNAGLSMWNGISKNKFLLTIIGMDGYTLWYGANFYILGEWFLGCIILLYMLFPILKFGVEKKPVITAIIILLIYFIGSKIYNGKIPVSIFFLFRIPEFAFGMYLVKYFKNIKWYMALTSFAILFCFELFSMNTVEILYKNTLIGISTVILVKFLCQKIKSQGFYEIFAKIGKYCYVIFLTHHFVIQEITMRFTGKYLSKSEVYAVFLLCLIVMSFVSGFIVKINKDINTLIKEIRDKQKAMIA